MEASGQLHATATLLSRNEHPESVEYKSVCVRKADTFVL